MSEGNSKVGKIIWPLQKHIKDGADPQTNRQHYNIVYEAIWDLVNRNDQLHKIIVDHIPDDVLTNEEVQFLLKDLGIDMSKAYARLKKALEQAGKDGP